MSCEEMIDEPHAKKIDDFLKRNPPPADFGPAPGKAFYDELWDDPD